MREIRDMQIIQIDVTNRCEHRCSNCTRMLAHHPRRYDMTPEQFERAVRSLIGFPGIIGVFGGNPTLSPHFADYCRIMQQYVRKDKAGLWSNKLNGHGLLIRETFGYFNLNVHGDAKAAEEIRRDLPGVPVYGEEPCWHKPSMVALRDVLPESQWAEVIDKCPIPNRWSAIISPTPYGELSCFPCEIMSAFAWMLDDGCGKCLYDGWWKTMNMNQVSGMFDFFCPQCGLCLDLPARKDSDRLDDVSQTHLARAGKRAVLMDNLSDGLDLTEHGDSLDYTLKRSNPQERRLQQ